MPAYCVCMYTSDAQGPRPHFALSRMVALSCVVLVGSWVVSCGGKQTGDEGNASEHDPDHIVENMPPPAPAPDEEPEASPPSAPGGPLDSCRATTWTNPDEEKREASCTQYWDESAEQPVLKYVCSCDLAECPLFGELVDDGDPNTPLEAPLNDCVLDGVASGCRDSLETVCGVTPGEHGFCEQQYHGLTPTRPEQDPPDSATVACFEEADGTHACACPGSPELVPTTDSDCNRALQRACQAPCEAAAGRCEPVENGFDCTCTAGFERTVETGLCDYALFWACEPACSNEAGGCYWDPSGGSEILCLCNDDAEPQSMDRDPDVEGDECRTPLVETCGGSADGPGTWP